MIFDNVRTETMNRGDMNAMLAACQLGRDRLLRLFQRYGADIVMSAAYDWMDYSRARCCATQIAQAPGRRVHGADAAGSTTTRATAACGCASRRRSIVEGDEITIDLTGSNAEVPTGYNVPFEGSLLVGAYYAVRTILLDEVTFPEHVPQNDGVFRPVKVIAPKGTIYNPTFPRACFSRFCQVQRVVDNTILALADALPEGVTAGNSAGIHFCAYSGLLRGDGRVLALPRGERGLVRRPLRQGRDGLGRQPDGEHAQQPDRGARHALPDPLRPVRAAARARRARHAGAAGSGSSAATASSSTASYSCEGDRQTDPPRGDLRRLGRPRRLVPQEPGHGAARRSSPRR